MRIVLPQAPEAGRCRKDPPLEPLGSTALPVPRFQTADPQSCERIHFCPSQSVNSFIPSSIGRNCYWLHFRDEGTEVQRQSLFT